MRLEINVKDFNESSLHYRLIDNCDFKDLAQLRWQFKIEEAVVRKKEILIMKEAFIKSCLDILTRSEYKNQFTHFGAFTTENKLIAMASVNQIAKIPEPLKLVEFIGYLTNVYTCPSYRNRGVGSKLLGMIHVWAKQHSIELLIVWPSEASVNFYKRNHFDIKNQPMIADYITINNFQKS